MSTAIEVLQKVHQIATCGSFLEGSLLNTALHHMLQLDADS